MKYSILFIKCPLTLCPSRILKYHFTSKKKKNDERRECMSNNIQKKIAREKCLFHSKKAGRDQ